MCIIVRVDYFIWFVYCYRESVIINCECFDSFFFRIKFYNIIWIYINFGEIVKLYILLVLKKLFFFVNLNMFRLNFMIYFLVNKKLFLEIISIEGFRYVIFIGFYFFIFIVSLELVNCNIWLKLWWVKIMFLLLRK